MAGVQDRISAVNKIYDTERADQTKVNVNNSGRTNALSGLMGLGGSSAADARATNTDNNSKQALDLVEAKRQAALGAIYDKVNDNVIRLKQAALDTNRANAKALYDEVAQSALDTVHSLASTVANNGATWDDFKAKDPTMAQNLIDQSGKSEYVLRELWKSQIPEQFKPVDHTDYFDDGKGGTVMKKVSFNPVTKQVETQEYPIGAPLSMFKAADKPIEVNGMLLVKQMDGTYKNMAPGKPDEFQPVTLTSKDENGNSTERIVSFNKTNGTFETKVASMPEVIKADRSNGIAPSKVTPETTVLDNSKSGSILAQTGLSLIAFKYLTEGTSALTRMTAGARKQVMNEADSFLNKNGLDVSTFSQQYKTYNTVLGANIERLNKTKIMENEIEGTLDNLKTVANDAELGKLKYGNVAKIWAGEQVNDPLAQKYSFHLQQLKNEVAGYFAASQGKNSPDVVDNNDADKAIKDGLSKGSLTALEQSVKASTGKMGGVMQNSVDSTRKAVWDLFGVGDNYKPQGSSSKVDAATIDSDIKHAIKDTARYQTREQLASDLAQHYGISQDEAQQRVNSKWTDNLKR